MPALLCLLLAFAACLRGAEPEPLFSFALIADVQYADKDRSGARDYRASLRKLEEAAVAINAARPAFSVQLGDLIDERGDGNLPRILGVLGRIRSPRYHVPGNHDFSAGRDELLRMLGLRDPWYTFAHGGWRFVVLDGMDASVTGRPPGSEGYHEGEKMRAEVRARGGKNAADWNGGVGERQRRWLRDVLRSASAGRERVIVFCHFPVVEASSTPAHLLWNHEEVVRIVEESGAVAAWFNGHDHNGGYALHNGIHYVTFPGMVESGAETSWTLVRVFPGRLELRGSGTAPSHILEIGR